ncbi:MAG: glycosyltransferase family 4 protein [Candidatus Heimdallarchaeota archaeon]
MRVCLLSQKFPPMAGGISRYVQNVSRELSELDVDVTVVTLRPRGCPKFEKIGNVQIYRVLSGSDLSVNLYLVWVKRIVAKLIKKKEIDIIHGQLPLIQTVLLPKTTTPFVETVHSVSKIEVDALKNVPFSEIAAWEKYLIVFASVYRGLEKIVFSKADACIAVSHHVKEEVLNEFGQELGRRTTVIPNGVNTSQFHPNIEGIQFRKRLGTEQDYILGFLGRLCGRKNIKTLVLAFSLVAKEDPQVKLAIGGSGDAGYIKQIVELAIKRKIRDKIVFTGYVPEKDVPKFYSACDAIVVPSFQESFGITILEGMATAKPIIAAKAGGIIEFVKNGENGLLFDPKNPVDLTKAVMRIKDNLKLARRISTQARKMVEKNYSWSVITQKILKIYDKLI